ncbi:MAG: response regulator [Lachnospiraceae bacterium]|nr:response regulator [Lachnospiraceae bacterium]
MMQNFENNLQGIQMLYVGKSTDSGIPTADILSNTGILCQYVSDSHEALSKIACQKFDIIFINSILPGEDGITALSRIHNTHLCDEIPIVIVTEENTGIARQSYLSAGFTEHLEKPVTLRKISDIIVRCLNLTLGNETLPNTISHILVIDDDNFNLVLAKRILEKQFQVSTVTSGKQGFSFLEQNNVDLILLDIRMPEMDGFTFLELIKQQPLLRDIPVICLTADNEPASELKALEMGALDFITKPFIAQIMFRRITRILELGRLQHKLQKEVEKKTLTLNKRSQQLNRLTVQVMKTLARTIDAKDKYTNGHSIRVAEYSRMIANRLNMNLHDQENIYYIGLLHDIGKIGIPDEIINKTSRLTDEEYAVIKTHPVIGSEILEKMSELPEIALGARWHHERFDGKGYPDSLKGEDIPMVARIIGVADAYDAMSSKRSYRGILPQEYIYKEIKRCSGTQFDPVVAEIMLQIITEDTEYKLREL